MDSIGDERVVRPYFLLRLEGDFTNPLVGVLAKAGAMSDETARRMNEKMGASLKSGIWVGVE